MCFGEEGKFGWALAFWRGGSSLSRHAWYFPFHTIKLEHCFVTFGACTHTHTQFRLLPHGHAFHSLLHFSGTPGTLKPLPHSQGMRHCGMCNSLLSDEPTLAVFPPTPTPWRTSPTLPFPEQTFSYSTSSKHATTYMPSSSGTWHSCGAFCLPLLCLCGLGTRFLARACRLWPFSWLRTGKHHLTGRHLSVLCTFSPPCLPHVYHA